LYAAGVESDHRGACDPIGDALRTTAMSSSRPLAARRPSTSVARAVCLSLVSARRVWTTMPSGDDLVELVRAVAAAGDRSAFAVLFKHFAPRVKAYLVRSGMAPGLAEELAQETMVNVWRKAASFNPDRAQLSTWIFTIARNLRVDHLRRQRNAPAALEGAPEDADGLLPLEGVDAEAERPDAQLDAARRDSAVRDALQQLAPEQLQAVWMAFYDEQSHARIASELGVPLGTVKSRIRLAVNRLRRLLQGLEP
jgi:RNA polymerase sigma factor (sigma-70 family)